jgi:hypothetical protein
MFFINKLKTKKSGTRPGRHARCLGIVGRRNTKKAPRLGDGSSPGERLVGLVAASGAGDLPVSWPFYRISSQKARFPGGCIHRICCRPG